MKRVLLILAAAILALSAQAYTLTPDRTELQWDDWDINIKSLVDTNAVGAGTFRAKEAGDDSLFVQMLLTVKNNSHKGFSFAPSAVVRLIIGENEFDAENLESSDSYVDNIEPTLVRERDCYFEVPKALFKDSFTLRFSALLTESAEVHVSIAKPMPTPIPTPTPASTPEPLSIPEARPIPEILATPTPEPKLAPGGAERADSIGTPSNTEQEFEGKSAEHPWDFILEVWKRYNNHHSNWIKMHTVAGVTNFFGRKHASDTYVLQDMHNDALRYSQWHSSFDPNSFWHEVSKEYSSQWIGPMLYDHIDFPVSEVYETGVRWHRARVHFIVGYTLAVGYPKIYALLYQPY